MIYDLIVLGGGPGGYLAAERAGEAGLKTVLIEKNKLGGVCLNEGCIPSKTLLYSAKLLEHARDSSKYGVTAAQVDYDQAAVIKRKNKVVRKLVAGVKAQLNRHQVELVSGSGFIRGRRDGLLQVEAAGQIYQGRHLVIATGSQPLVPPIEGVAAGMKSGFVLTNREILDLEHIPERLVVIGGGVIGLEMASYYQTCGSQVTVIEMLDHLAGQTDRELTAILQRHLAGRGMQFFLSSKVNAVTKDSVVLVSDGKELSLAADRVLLSAGRRPVIDEIGLESLSVYTEKGAIVTNEQGLTNVANVYAVGDVNGKWMLAHTAYREAEVAVATMLGRHDRVRYQAMPSVIYTQPELAYVGETEETCRTKGLDYQLVSLPMQYSGRYVAENESGDGMIKLLVDPHKKRLLGCHLLGGYASEIILAAGMMIDQEMSLDMIRSQVFPHPTVAEIIREAVFSIESSDSNKADR